ncbi:hypothetical protein E2C01_064229 [Portunus trituberculatus]|uniref:Uncharacterized protein n=1 Tax=Portunus trituberculatus TaxID=210409 RepID=A0A5B7HK93_PORTR|nr:hypothetical protein [Portunus trituberculatus]
MTSQEASHLHLAARASSITGLRKDRRLVICRLLVLQKKRKKGQELWEAWLMCSYYRDVAVLAEWVLVTRAQRRVYIMRRGLALSRLELPC